MTKKKILVLYSLPPPYLPNGSPDTPGRESVLFRLNAVRKALLSLGHKVKTLEAKGDLLSLVKAIQSSRADLIFNLCEEFIGRTRMEMNIAALLELMEIPFTGSSAIVLGLSQDKGKTKSLFAHCGIPTPAYRVWLSGKDGQVDGLRFPLIVKPLKEDASLGIDNDAVVQNIKTLRQRVKIIHQAYRQPVLVEEYIEGRELNVSIIGNEKPQVLPISEIDFSTMPPEKPKICGYSAKWLEDSQEFVHTVPRCPADLSPKLGKKVLQVSLQAYRTMECRDYARVDIRLSLEGTPFVLEINANPDISPDAGMIRSSRTAGFTYPEFIGRIVELAQARSTSPFAYLQKKKISPKRKPGA